ncbi:MAG: glycoside hydrolase family 43 protein [Ilumatobacteraceae bacterium]
MSYRNPVIPGFHPDPSVCRVGDDFYIAVSSFTYFPGVPIFHSTNLVDWTQIGNALDRPSQLDLSETQFGVFLGVFAPTLRHHDGRFWMITTVYSHQGPDNFFATAEDPAGPWSEPVHFSLRGIDPDIAWDADGNCWVHASNGQSILRCRIDDVTGEVLDEPTEVWSGTGLQYPEAPHVFERDGTWYLLIAEGGTERGHAVSIARGPSPVGPWEGCPANPILSHRSTSLPIQNTGHSDLVEAVDGSWWMVLLATRPRGGSPGYHVLGRETFLAPVEWVDGWPVVDHVRLEYDVRPPGPATFVDPHHCDDFESDHLDRRWLTVRRPASEFASLDRRTGWLTLTAGDETLDSTSPTLVARRQQHERFVARTMVDTGTATEAGLVVLMDEHHHYEIAVADGTIAVRARIGPLATTVATAPSPTGPCVLVVEAKPGSRGPDQLAFGVEGADGTIAVLAELDGRYLSTEVACGMTGRVVGMYAVGGVAAFDWFDYSDVATEA